MALTRNWNFALRVLQEPETEIIIAGQQITIQWTIDGMSRVEMETLE